MTILKKIPSSLELVHGFISRFMKEIRILSLGHNDIFDIKLSLEEALVNAIKHGNKMDPGALVEFRADIEDGKLTMEVTNAGPGFDYQSIPDPTALDKLQRTSGRGIFLIKKLMDRVEFSDCGRTIKMIKFIHKV